MNSLEAPSGSLLRQRIRESFFFNQYPVIHCITGTKFLDETQPNEQKPELTEELQRPDDGGTLELVASNTHEAASSYRLATSKQGGETQAGANALATPQCEEIKHCRTV